MRRFFIVLSALLVLSFCVTARPVLAHDPEEIPGLVDRLIDTVVSISADAKKGEEGQESPKKDETLGSGFVIDASGQIVTNAHIIEDADELTVTLNDGSKLEVEKVVGSDPKTDLAVLKVKPKIPLMAVTFGDSAKVRIGQVIVAIGSPFGFPGSVTSGIVSALNRDINVGPYDDYIQTDAALNKGNAGGPLFNLKGEVIGINSAIVSPTGGSTGVGFALASNSARIVIDQLRKSGETRRGWLGVRIQGVTDEVAASLNMKKPTGVLVVSVTAGGPAQKGGIEAADVILTFDGQEVSNLRALPRIVAGTEIGKGVDVEVLRKGQKRILMVRIGRLPESPAAKRDKKRPSTAPKDPGKSNYRSEGLGTLD